MDLVTDVKYVKGLDIAAAAAADRTGAVVDMSGFQGVRMCVIFPAVATGATVSIKAQTATTAAFTTPHDVTGTAQTVADDADNNIFVIDLLNPAERYVRLYVDNDATNNTTSVAWYELYGPDAKPTTQGTGVSYEQHVFPATGTA